MGSNSIPPKTLSDESINRGLVCAHMHFIARTQNILTRHVLMGECRQQKHTQHAPSTKTERDYLNGWIKKRSHTQKSHPKMVNPRDRAGERRRRRRRRRRRSKAANLTSHYALAVACTPSVNKAAGCAICPALDSFYNPGQCHSFNLSSFVDYYTHVAQQRSLSVGEGMS